MVTKHCWKWRNCSLREISSFRPVVSKVLYYRHVKTRACFGRVKTTKTEKSRPIQIEALADDKIKVTEKLKVVEGQLENIVGKGENAGYQQCSLKAFCTGCLTLSQMTNFRLFQTERACIQQFQI